MKDKQLEALIKKNMAKAEKPKSKVRPTYDSTLDVTRRPERPHPDPHSFGRRGSSGREGRR